MTAEPRPLVLVVEDEPALATLIDYNLAQDGFEVLLADDGASGLARAAERRPDLVLLDWMLPDMEGIEVCRRLRAGPLRDLPVILLTARGEEGDKVRGLTAGADDYVTKPFSPAELTARIRAVLRRAGPAVPSARGVLRGGDVTLDPTEMRVRRGTSDVKLGPTEFKLLKFLMTHAGRVFTREQLLVEVWGQDVFVETRTVDVHIRRLRKALNLDDTQPDVIRTVRSAGYAFVTDPAADL